MNVLDPFEVSEIELWPLWDLEGKRKDEVKSSLDSAEYTVFQLLLKKSTFGAVLNEVPVVPAPKMELPDSVRERIVPDSLYERRMHSDIRIARRASTMSKCEYR